LRQGKSILIVCELGLVFSALQRLKKMREDVETYEEAVRKQAALAKQAHLKKQDAKEQESKAKSIKDKNRIKQLKMAALSRHLQYYFCISSIFTNLLAIA
jgi:hypothetical protein